MVKVLKRIVFNDKQKVSLENFDLPEVGEKEILVKAELSQISIGTEMTIFNHVFDSGTHWDEWVSYPFYPGYSVVGVAEAVGNAVKNIRPGDYVVHRGNHASAAVVQSVNCYPIASGVSAEKAIWFSLAKIAAMGIYAANIKPGDCVFVIGAGPIGQMALRWALAVGAGDVICCDNQAERLKMATAGGAAIISAYISEALPGLASMTSGKMADVVIDTTGNAEVFTAAQKAAKKFGKVIILGDTGSPSKQNISSAVITKGLKIIGAHDGHDTDEWNSAKIINLFFKLVKQDRFNLNELNTYFFSPEQCSEAYAMLNKSRSRAMGVFFDWRQNKKKGF